MSDPWIRIASDGSLRLPREIVESLEWKTGSYLEVSVDGETVRLRRIEVDPFAEALKKPDEGLFDKVLREQQRSRDAAFKAFDEKIQKGDVPEVRPEDKPDYWR